MDDLGIRRRIEFASAPSEEDGEDRAFLGSASDRNLAAALFHGSVDGRQAEAESLAQGLGCEEGLEDSALCCFIHAFAVSTISSPTRSLPAFHVRIVSLPRFGIASRAF